MSDVAWVTSSYPWAEEPIGGIFFQTQARLLAARGLEVAVLVPTPLAPWPLSRVQRRWRSYARAPRIARDDGVTILRPRYPNMPGQPSVARPDRFIAAAAERAHRSWAGARLVHGHYAVTGLAAWRLARRTGLPFLLTFHGDDLNTWPDEHPERVADLRTAIRSAAAITVVSAPLAARVRALADIEAVHLPIGCDHDRLDAAAIPRAEARARLSIPQEAIVALFVGALLPEKGVREFADAIDRLGDPFLGILVGAGPERGYGLRNGGRRHLEYRGEQPNEAVVQFMSAADVLVLPSYGEGLPTVLVEAGSLGLPVIASQVGGVPDLLGADRGRLLREVSADAVAEALRGFVAEREAAIAAAARLRSHVLERHSAAKNAERLLEIYRSIAPGLGSSPSAAPVPSDR